MKISTIVCALSAFALTPALTFAQDYPTRTINMVVAYSAGGGTDVAARTLVPFIEQNLPKGATIAVINKPGASGELGFAEISKAKPDGYTIGFINTPTVITIPIQRKASFSLQDLVPIANVVFDAGSLVVLPDSPYGNLKDLISAAKAAPETITYGSTGIGSDDHLSMLALQQQTGITLRHVPFGGSSEIQAALLGGHIALGSMNIGEVIDNVNEGKLLSLGQMGEDRWQGALDVPTFREQGIDVVSGAYRGIGAPKDTDPAIIATLATAIAAAMKDAEFKQAAKKQSLPLNYQDPTKYAATLDNLQKLYKSLWDKNPWVK